MSPNQREGTVAELAKEMRPFSVVRHTGFAAAPRGHSGQCRVGKQEIDNCKKLERTTMDLYSSLS